MIVGLSLFKMTDSDFPFIYIKVVYRLVISSDIQKKEQKILSHCHKPASGTLLGGLIYWLMQEVGAGALRNIQQHCKTTQLQVGTLSA